MRHKSANKLQTNIAEEYATRHENYLELRLSIGRGEIIFFIISRQEM